MTPIIHALTETILNQHYGAEAAPYVEPTVSFVSDQLDRMTDYLRLPFRLLTHAFNLWPVLRYGRSFRRLPLVDRWRQIVAWKQAPVGFQRDLVKAYESLILFGYASEVYEHAST